MQAYFENAKFVDRQCEALVAANAAANAAANEAAAAAAREEEEGGGGGRGVESGSRGWASWRGGACPPCDADFFAFFTQLFVRFAQYLCVPTQYFTFLRSICAFLFNGV
jgi:hypothetical protein